MFKVTKSKFTHYLHKLCAISFADYYHLVDEDDITFSWSQSDHIKQFCLQKLKKKICIPSFLASITKNISKVEGCHSLPCSPLQLDLV